MQAQTSMMAFWSLTKGHISKQERIVLDALEEIAPATNRQVSEHANLPINVVTARMNAMAKPSRKVVVVAYIGKDMTGRSAKFWKPSGMEDEYGDSY